MKETEINRLEMFQAVNTYLDTHSSIWNAIVVTGRYKNQLSSTIEALKTAAGKQLQARVFVGKPLLELKQNIAEKMDILDDTLEGFAEDTENTELLLKAKNSKTKYFRLSHEDFETKVKDIIQLLEANAKALADYGVTEEQIEDVKGSFNQFLEQRGKPRQYQIRSSVATSNIDSLIKTGSKALEKIDRVLKRFKHANAEFYNGYISARKIIGD